MTSASGGGRGHGQSRYFLTFKPNLGDSDGGNRVEEAVLTNKFKPCSMAQAAPIWEWWYELTGAGCQHGEACKTGPSCTRGVRWRPRTLVTGAVLPIWDHIVDVIQGGREDRNDVVVSKKKKKGRPVKCVRLAPDSCPPILGLKLKEAPDEGEMLQEAIIP